MGKNILDAGLFSNLNRFSFVEKPGIFRRVIAKFMRIPDELLSNHKSKKGVNLCMFATNE